MAIAKQIVRSGTSPSANYRAACLAKSEKDFVNKLKMVEEEKSGTVEDYLKFYPYDETETLRVINRKS